MTPSNANTSGLEVVQWEYRTAPHRQWHITDSKAVADQEAKDGSEVVPRLVRAASAQARIAELEAERDVLKVEVIGLRAAIFGSHDYDSALRHANFIEMARATEDGRQGALNRATAAEARADRLARALERAADDLRDIGTQKPQPTNSPDPEHENYLRRVLISLGQVGNARARAALQQEK